MAKKGTFIHLLHDIINLMEEGSILNYGKRFSSLTISSYKQLYRNMKAYNYNFNIEELDLNGVRDRKHRLSVTRKLQTKVNGYLNLMFDDCKHHNTRKAHLKVLRSTLKKAEDYYGYLFPKLQSMRELKSEVIALEPHQVEFIHKNHPGKELEEVWYYTRLVLYSCMRISDLVNFETNIDGDAVTIITKKGVGSISSFYLPKDVKTYLEERGKFSYTEKNFRDKLKKLLKSYDGFWTKRVVYKYDYEGNPITKMLYLWEIITPHKLRSSGISYHLSQGLSEFEVRKISGHVNSSQAFYRYVQLSNRESIEKQKKYANLLIKS